MNNLEQEIADLEQRLHALDAERAILAQALGTLRQRRQEQIDSFAQRVAESTVTHQSSRQDNIKLFRDLFKGREDIYPKRFESSKTGKTGYSPVCLNDKFAWWANLHSEAARRTRGMNAPNEWHPTPCHKPRIKCSECHHLSAKSFEKVTNACKAKYVRAPVPLPGHSHKALLSTNKSPIWIEPRSTWRHHHRQFAGQSSGQNLR